jgi:hypothetical protein
MLRVSLILLVVPVLATVASASEEDPFNVDFFCGWAGHYRPMEWTPVEIGITSTLTEPFAGSVTILAQQDGLNSLNIVHTFVLTPNIPLHLPLVTKLAFTADNCSVRISNERGRTQWRHDFELWNFSTRNRFLTAVGENDLLVGLVGRGKFGLLRLPKESVCRSHKERGKVYIGDKLPRMVPWDWTGFVPLDVLILYDPDWNLFKRQQLNAIAQWVSNGGKLLLVLGSHPLPSANPIAQLLPFELQDVKQITVSPQILEKWGLTPSEPETVAAWSLVPKPEARFYEAETYDADECLFATGCAGFGRVGVLAFDPSSMTSELRASSALFWVSRIRAVLEDARSLPDSTVARRLQSNRISRSIEFAGDAESVADSSSGGRRYEVGWAHAANNAVMEFLYQGIEPLSIWWVILLLTALAVLLGPLDYKLLKRKGRLPLTWLTCTFWIILFTIGAYYGVQALRGGGMELRVVSVLDGIENSDHAWSTDYCGLFAPHSDDYRLEGLQDNQWWSGIAPTQESIWAYNREVAGRRIYCFQHDGGNLPYSLPINIWTIQCLLNESPLDGLPFKAELEHDGDEIVVNIVNESKSAILNGYVLVDNNRGINFGPVPAGAGKQFRNRLKAMRIWDDYGAVRDQEYYSGRRRYSGSFRRKDAFFAQGCLQRTQATASEGRTHFLLRDAYNVRRPSVLILPVEPQSFVPSTIRPPYRLP